METKDTPVEEPEEPEKVKLILPHGGEKGQQLMSTLGRSIENTLDGVKLRTSYELCEH